MVFDLQENTKLLSPNVQLDRALELTLYKGVLEGAENSWARFTYHNGNISEAYFDGETKGATLKKFRRPISAISSTQTVYEAFKLMTQERLHIMMVVDEFGNVEGVVTIEDVIETLLGMEIIDEADRTEDMQQVARELWKKRARAMGIEIKDEQKLNEQLISEEGVQ